MALVEITETSHNVLLDLRYASTENIVGTPFYTRAACFLHDDAERALSTAIDLAAHQGLTLKIFDAFRPLEAQQILWDRAPNPEFVSNPQTGSCPHCRGVAVDLTLVDSAGSELDMGTGFDDFSQKAFHGNTEICETAQQNRYTLMGIMMTAGWDFYRNEWWHYQLFNCREYDLLNDADAGTKLIG